MRRRVARMVLVTPSEQSGVSRLQNAHPHGFLAVELLLALPVLLLLAFSITQLGVLWHTRLGLSHAVTVAARHAAVSHGADAAIRDGLISGLAPILAKVDSLDGLTGGLINTSTEVARGVAGGWIRWEVLSPTRESFQDWGAPVDRLIDSASPAGEIEIPSMALPAIALRRRPSSGTGDWVDGLPVGIASGQTLLEANVLKLRLRFGVPLDIPFAGRLMARTLAWWSGCGAVRAGRQAGTGILDFGVDHQPDGMPWSVQCAALGARGTDGSWRPRWPMEVTASVQMQSNARRSGMSLRSYSSQ
jgi:hypothetical protein